MTAATILIEARGVSRRHPDGQRWLLDDVSLAIPAAARLGIAGPSGAGKTLLLRVLAALDPLDRGEVLWRGQPVARDRVPGFRKAVVYLHQRPALWEDTVEAALRGPFSLAVHRPQAFDRDRIVGLLDQLGRDDSFLTKRTADLSGGEMQMVALLRAIQLDPVVLLLDEPTAALDGETTKAVETLLRDWVDAPSQGRALVWVSHDARQTRNMASTILTMRNGTIQDGPSPGS